MFECFEDVQVCGVKIYGEIVGYYVNLDVFDYVFLNLMWQVECVCYVIVCVEMKLSDIYIVNIYVMVILLGDIQECEVICVVFGEGCFDMFINNMKSFIGYVMGVVGVLELVGNLLLFDDLMVYFMINVDDFDL